MAVAYEDKTAATQKANGSSGASASADFTTALAAGESVYSFQMTRGVSGTVVSGVKLIELDAGGTPVSPPIEYDMTPVAYVGILFESTVRQLSIYRHNNTSAAKYRSTVTAGSTGAAITTASLAFSGALSLAEMAVDTAATGNGATTLTLNSLPQGSNLPVDEGVAVLVLSGNDTQPDYAWPDLSGDGWTRQINVTDGSVGLHPLAIYTKTISTAAPITVSPTFSAATFGAVGLLMLLLPQEPTSSVTQYVKLRSKDNAAQGLDGINVKVHIPDAGSDVIGAPLFASNSNAWDGTEVDGGVTKATMLIPVPDPGTFETAVTLTAGDNLLVVGEGDGHGIVGVAVGTVIEIVEGS